MFTAVNMIAELQIIIKALVDPSMNNSALSFLKQTNGKNTYSCIRPKSAVLKQKKSSLKRSC
jgi:hypothetical protein